MQKDDEYYDEEGLGGGGFSAEDISRFTESDLNHRVHVIRLGGIMDAERRVAEVAMEWARKAEVAMEWARKILGGANGENKINGHRRF